MNFSFLTPNGKKHLIFHWDGKKHLIFHGDGKLFMEDQF